MIFDKIVFQPTAPTSRGVIWARPIGEGFALYIHNKGMWQALKMVDDGGTVTPDDDIPGTGGSLSDADKTIILQKIEAIQGTNDTTPQIDSQKEVTKFLADYKNSDTLKEVLDDATATATKEDVLSLFK